MSQQNTALIDDIMAALDAESSQNVELIVRNTQNGATKKMALASLEQIIYSYLTTAPVVTNLASVLGVPMFANRVDYTGFDNFDNLADGLYFGNNFGDNAPFVAGFLFSMTFNAQGTTFKLQVLVKFDAATILVRTQWGGIDDWGAWKWITLS